MTLPFIVGVQLLVVAVILFAATPVVQRRAPGGALPIAIARNALLVVGIVLVAIDLAGTQTPMSRTANPVAFAGQSVEAGRVVYTANCAACHGVDARGGGPLADTTPVTPPSLVAHLSGHSDGDLFYWISNGLPGGMPAWADRLTETQRWDLVNYLRAINGRVPGADTDRREVATVRTASPRPTERAVVLLPVLVAVGGVMWLLGGWRRSRRRRRRRPSPR